MTHNYNHEYLTNNSEQSKFLADYFPKGFLCMHIRQTSPMQKDITDFMTVKPTSYLQQKYSYLYFYIKIE